MKTIQRLIHFLLNPPVTAPQSVLVMRLMAGGVFLSEGILKFVYTNQGVGRFTKLGIPLPDITATFVGSLEIVGGILLMAGLLTRVIAIPFIIEMVVAILTTKISLYLGTSPLPLPPALPKVSVISAVSSGAQSANSAATRAMAAFGLVKSIPAIHSCGLLIAA